MTVGYRDKLSYIDNQFQNSSIKNGLNHLIGGSIRNPISEDNGNLHANFMNLDMTSTSAT